MPSSDGQREVVAGPYWFRTGVAWRGLPESVGQWLGGEVTVASETSAGSIAATGSLRQPAARTMLYGPRSIGTGLISPRLAAMRSR